MNKWMDGNVNMYLLCSLALNLGFSPPFLYTLPYLMYGIYVSIHTLRCSFCPLFFCQRWEIHTVRTYR